MNALEDHGRAILLTSDGIEHRHVASKLLETIPDLEIIIENRGSGIRTGGAKRALKRGIAPFVDKCLRSLFLRLIGDRNRKTRALRRHLPESEDARLRIEAALHVPSINAKQVVQRILELQPRLVLVYGTGLVKRPVIEAAETTVLNLHTGLSPFYRGVGCYLWPIVDRRFDRIGITIHDCILQLDAGSILATDTIEVVKGDGIHDVFARQVAEGARQYAEIAGEEYWKRIVPRREQNLSLGREYRGAELGVLPEIRGRWNLRRLHAKSK